MFFASRDGRSDFFVLLVPVLQRLMPTVSATGSKFAWQPGVKDLPLITWHAVDDC